MAKMSIRQIAYCRDTFESIILTALVFFEPGTPMKDLWTIVLSVFALVFSIVSFIISNHKVSVQLSSSTRDQLGTIIQKLIEVDSQISENQFADQSQALFYLRASNMSYKESSLAREAKALVDAEAGIVNDVEYVVMARCFSELGDYPQAAQYWKQAVDAAPSDYYKMINLRGFADFDYAQGKYEDGRTIYQKALTVFDNSSDFNKCNNGYTYQMWAVSENKSLPRQFNKAGEYYKEARALFETISNPTSKDFYLRGLDISEKTGVATTPAVASQNAKPEAQPSATP